jgi:hypothetical protein
VQWIEAVNTNKRAKVDRPKHFSAWLGASLQAVQGLDCSFVIVQSNQVAELDRFVED